jgi:hypothetical protein
VVLFIATAPISASSKQTHGCTQPDGIQSFFACKMTSGPIPSPDNTAILNSWGCY